tara:strand:- start:50 stop:319 length:270 start_codon:yes stop_codon:yes gene_type:complete
MVMTFSMNGAIPTIPAPASLAAVEHYYFLLVLGDAIAATDILGDVGPTDIAEAMDFWRLVNKSIGAVKLDPVGFATVNAALAKATGAES